MIDDMKLQLRVMEVLRGSRVFGVLDAEVLSDLARVLTLQVVRGGEQVVREGEPANSMLFVINGCLRVSRRDADGNLLLFNEIRPGASFGETGLILERARAADVTALRDSTLAVLSRADFEALLVRHPLPLNRVVVHAIHNYFRHETREARGYAQSVVVVPLHAGADAGEVARGLTEAFGAMGRACHLRPDGQALAGSTASLHHLEVERNDMLETQFDYLVYEAEPHPSDWTQRAFRQADQVVFVVASTTAPQVSEFETRLMREPGSVIKRRHLVVTYPAAAHQPHEVGRWHRSRPVERVYPVRERHHGDYARLARFLNGTPVGLVLGGGGARGFAHLGVIRALHECGVAIDLIGGNSMGALIGAQYASELALDDIIERTRRFALGGERPTLPLISLMSGKRVERDLKKMFGDAQVDGLWRPYFASACNLSKGCTVVQESGPMWRAVLASNSPAGLFPPVLFQGDLLVDGAILENVPVSAMRARLGSPQEKRRGNGTIIAVDVDVQQDLCVHADMARLSVWGTLKGLVRPGLARNPGIGEILYRAGHMGGLSQRARAVAQSDHYFEPPVGKFPIMGYRSAASIVEVGYRYAMEKVSQWER